VASTVDGGPFSAASSFAVGVLMVPDLTAKAAAGLLCWQQGQWVSHATESSPPHWKLVSVCPLSPSTPLSFVVLLCCSPLCVPPATAVAPAPSAAAVQPEPPK